MSGAVYSDSGWFFPASGYPDRHHLLQPSLARNSQSSSMRHIEVASWEPDEPVDCSEARGKSSGANATFAGTPYPSSASCTRNTRIWPKKSSRKSLLKGGIPLTPIRPLAVLGEKTALALGPPIAVLIIGWALIWAMSGFAKSQFTPSARFLSQYQRVIPLVVNLFSEEYACRASHIFTMRR